MSPVLNHCFKSASPVFHQCFTSVSLVLPFFHSSKYFHYFCIEELEAIVGKQNFTSDSAVFHQCFTIVSILFHNCFTIISLLFRQCFTSVSLVYHQYFTSVSPVYYQCFTSVSRVFHGCYTGVSRVFHWCFKRVQKCFKNASKVFHCSYPSIRRACLFYWLAYELCQTDSACIKKSPPYARVAAMTLMPTNNFETFLRHLWKSLKLFWNSGETLSFAYWIDLLSLYPLEMAEMCSCRLWQFSPGQVSPNHS